MTPVWNFKESDYQINVLKFALRHFNFGLVEMLLGTTNLLYTARRQIKAFNRSLTSFVYYLY